MKKSWGPETENIRWEHKPTRKDRVNEILFNSTFGTVILGAMCIILFLVTFGFGYLICGLMLVNHITKMDPKSSGGSGLLGVLFIWPVALLMRWLDPQ